MDKNFRLFLFCVLYTSFLVAVAIIYGYYQGIAHARKDTQITQNGEILTFNLDGDEWIYILERR